MKKPHSREVRLCKFKIQNSRLICDFRENRYTRWRPRLKIAPPYATECILSQANNKAAPESAA